MSSIYQNYPPIARLLIVKVLSIQEQRIRRIVVFLKPHEKIIPSSYINVSSYVTRFHPHDLSIYARNATHATRGKTRADTRDAAFFPNGGVGGFEGRGSRSGFPGMEITKFHRAAKIRAQRGPPYSQKQVCRGNKTGINLHGRVGNNGRETGVHRRERKLCARAAT